VFDDLHLVAEDGRAVAVFTAGGVLRDALADALSWHVTRRFQATSLEAPQDVVELRAAGALADKLDEFRGHEERAPVRLAAIEARALLEAGYDYIAERDVDGYQPPEERDRIGQLQAVIDPLFDLIAQLERADKVLGGSSL
jgi:hypothetical protein